MFSPTSRDTSLPMGVSDFLPEQADTIGHIEARVCRVFELWGFRRIITPLLEFQDVMATGLGEELKERTFRFDDRQTGRLLAIPPDITPQVARIVATRLRGAPLPHRLYYHGRVLRHAAHQSGRSREIFQAVVELIELQPELQDELEGLHGEHSQLLELLEQIRELAGSSVRPASTWDDVESRFHRFQRALSHHQRRHDDLGERFTLVAVGE